MVKITFWLVFVSINAALRFYRCRKMYIEVLKWHMEIIYIIIMLKSTFCSIISSIFRQGMDEINFLDYKGILNGL